MYVVRGGGGGGVGRGGWGWGVVGVGMGMGMVPSTLVLNSVCMFVYQCICLNLGNILISKRIYFSECKEDTPNADNISGIFSWHICICYDEHPKKCKYSSNELIPKRSHYIKCSGTKKKSFSVVGHNKKENW